MVPSYTKFVVLPSPVYGGVTVFSRSPPQGFRVPPVRRSSVHSAWHVSCCVWSAAAADGTPGEAEWCSQGRRCLEILDVLVI